MGTHTATDAAKMAIPLPTMASGGAQGAGGFPGAPAGAGAPASIVVVRLLLPPERETRMLLRPWGRARGTGKGRTWRAAMLAGSCMMSSQPLLAAGARGWACAIDT